MFTILPKHRSCSEKTFDKSNLKEKRFILAHSGATIQCSEKGRRQLHSCSQTRNRRVEGRTMVRYIFFKTHFQVPTSLAGLQVPKFGVSPNTVRPAENTALRHRGQGGGYFPVQTLSADFSIRLDCQYNLVPPNGCYARQLFKSTWDSQLPWIS